MSDEIEVCSVKYCERKRNYPSTFCKEHLMEIMESPPSYKEIQNKAVERFKLALLSDEAVEAATTEHNKTSAAITNGTQIREALRAAIRKADEKVNENADKK